MNFMQEDQPMGMNMGMDAARPVHIIEDEEDNAMMQYHSAVAASGAAAGVTGPSQSPSAEAEYELEDLMDMETTSNSHSNTTAAGGGNNAMSNSVSTLQNSVDSFEEALNETRLFARQVVCNEADRVQKRLLEFQQAHQLERQDSCDSGMTSSSDQMTMDEDHLINDDTAMMVVQQQQQPPVAAVAVAAAAMETAPADAVERPLSTAEKKKLGKSQKKSKKDPNSKRPSKRRRKTRARQVSGAEQAQAQVLQQEANRSHKMMYLLQQMEHIQSQLLDEMNACADDADLRGDY